ncbi:MAG: ABC transporter permease [Calditrichaeota bacterium]|nr:ABC transporter permease [Calditrichota bacterium]
MRLFFIFKEGLQGFKRAPLATTISVMAIAISLFLVGLFGLSVYNLTDIFQRFYQTVHLEVFIDPSLSVEQRTALRSRIQRIPAVERVEYVSPDQALREFEKEFGEELVTVLQQNPLPPSFRVVLKKEFRELATVETIVDQILALPEVDEVVFQRELIRFFQKYFKLAFATALVLGAIILFISVLLVFNTIRLTIHGRRNLIEIMRLVGATNFFVKGPFLVEGMIQGLIGGAIACGLLWLIIDLARIFITDNVLLPAYFYSALLGFGILLGFLGSWLSVNKYLKF